MAAVRPPNPGSVRMEFGDFLSRMEQTCADYYYFDAGFGGCCAICDDGRFSSSSW